MEASFRKWIMAAALMSGMLATETSWEALGRFEVARWPVSLVAWISCAVVGLVSVSMYRGAPRLTLPVVALFSWACWGLIAANWSPLLPSSFLISAGVLSMVAGALAFVRAFGWTVFSRAATVALALFLLAGLAFEILSEGGGAENRFRGLGHGATDAGRIGGLLVLSALSARIRPALALPAVVLGFTVIFLADARTALAGLIIALVVAAHRSLRWWRPEFTALAMGAAALGIILIFAGVGTETAEAISRREGGAEISSFTGRTALWDLALVRAAEAPIVGHGSGSSRQIFSDGTIEGFYPWTANNAHNAVLQVLLEHGVVGVTLLLLAVGAGATASRNAPATVPAVMALLALNSLTEAMFHEPAAAVLFLAAAIGSTNRPEPATAANPDGTGQTRTGVYT